MFFVDDNVFVVCFECGIIEDLVKELVGFVFLCVVFCDNGFIFDVVKINVI